MNALCRIAGIVCTITEMCADCLCLAEKGVTMHFIHATNGVHLHVLTCVFFVKGGTEALLLAQLFANINRQHSKSHVVARDDLFFISRNPVDASC